MYGIIQIVMKITEADGVHYCQDCDKITLDINRESIWYCTEHAKKRGWNIIDGKRVKILPDACCYNPDFGLMNGKCKTCGHEYEK